MSKDLKKLKDKIIQKAEKKSQRIVERAEKTKERNIRRGERKARKLESQAEKEGEQLLQQEKQKISYETRVKKRRIHLRARQKVLNLLRDDLRDKLQKLLKEGELDDWIKKELIENIINQSEQYKLLCRKNMVEKYERIFQDCNNISIQEQEMKPGFILVSENNEYDFTLETIANRLVESEKKAILSSLEIGEENNG